MDNILTAKIYNFLQLEKPTEEQIIEGATLLLKCNPNRERSIYNNALRRPSATLPWIRADLKKYYDIRQRGLTTEQVEEFNNETVQRVSETLSIVPEGLEKDNDDISQIPQLGTRGKREDHDKLPEAIQAIWHKNAERWKRMRQLHVQLSQLIAKSDYSPCDGNELCYLLRKTDTDIRNDYAIYDSYVLEEPKNKEEGKDKMEVFTDNVKTIQNARTTISRGLARKSEHNDKSLQKMQDAVNTLTELKQTIKLDTAKKLQSLGIAIPEDVING